MANSEETLSTDSNGQGNTKVRPYMERALPGIRSPWMATERKMWSKMFITFSVLLIAIIMGILSIYWGADHSLQFNLPVFTVAVIDFDGGEVGPYLQQMAAAERTMNPEKTLGFVSEPG
ncbi:MNNG and nitrosoguanidine resistance protein [Diplocarpon rosae]|nr:MNNG and nitrosoguanidine resistance protein [Diplocarpon rosae]